MSANGSQKLKDSATLEAKSELQEYLHVRDERRRLMPRALAVGLVSGFVAVAFRASLDWGDRVRESLVLRAHESPVSGPLIPVAFSLVTVLLGLFVIRRFAPEAAGSGIPHLEGVLRRHRVLRWWIVLPVKFVGGVLAIASGMALGREGPTVQMGGSVGMGLAGFMKSTRRETLILTAAGAGAGLAAAFNAPLAGLVFVLEELQRDFRPTVFAAAFIAAATADVVTRIVAGQLPIYSLPAYPAMSLDLLPAFLVLGLVAGLLGVVFNKSLVGALNGYAKLGNRVYWAAGVVGISIGLVAYYAPETVGGGNHVVDTALGDGRSSVFLPALLLLRFVLTIGSYGTGVAGGIFAPLLALGALLGRGVGDLTASVAPALVTHPGVFGVVGMAALFTAIVRAPLTGIVLIVEMTASYQQMLPLLVACFAAYATAEWLKDLPIYEALLQRDLLRGGISVNEDAPFVLELEVHPEAPFAGKRVRELGLPAGVVLVMLQLDEKEVIPTADTVLEPESKLTAIVSPESPGGEAAVRHGCGE